MRHGTLFVCLLAVAVLCGTIPGLGAETPNEPPEAEAGLDQSVEQGATVLLDAGGSWDPDGEIAAVEWWIRAPNETAFEPDCGSCVETAFVPRRLGTYNVTVTVTDDDGATRSDTLFVTVEPASPPTVDLTAAAVGNGTSWRVRADARAGDHDLQRLVWRVDGTRIDVESASGERATRERTLDFGPNETHVVSVTVADWLGNRGRDSVTLDTGSGGGNQPPTIEIVRAPDELQTDQPGQFVARATDPDGGSVDVSWSPSGQTGRSAQLSWGSRGTYTVTATATDDEGATATDHVTVLVTAGSDGGGSPGLLVDITQWPEKLEVGENGTFRAEARTADGQPLPITWDPGTKSGETVVMSWDSPGNKTVTATGTYNETLDGTDSVTVEVVEQNGPVADMNINPDCGPDRSYLCGPTTGNNQDPIEFSGSTSKPGGGDIVSYSWAINGSVISNQETFSDTFSTGHYNVTLTVEDEFGKTDTTSRTFDVVSSGANIEVALENDLDNLCSDNSNICTWDGQANELTILKDKTTDFDATLEGLPNNYDNLEWSLPSALQSGSNTRTGKSQSITWNSLGTGTMKLRYYKSGDTVAAVDTVSVTVVNESANQAPQVTIDDIHEICAPDGYRYPGGSCDATSSIEVTYTVWDPDNTGQVTLDGFLSPEGTKPIENETVSPDKTTYTTDAIPVTKDGDHQIRIVADDSISVSDATASFYIANATGESQSITVAGSWSMDIILDDTGYGSAKATTRVKCKTPDSSSKCPGKKIQVNWGDGSSITTLTSNIGTGSNSWETNHRYSKGNFPTMHVNVLDESGTVVKTMKRYLDLHNNVWSSAYYKFDKFLKANEPNPISASPGYQYRDSVSIKDPYGSATWVENKNSSIRHDDWIQIVDTRTQYSWTDQYRYAVYKPHCSGDCEWVLVERNARVTRGMYLDTKWYDERQWGKEYQFNKAEYNKIQEPKYRVHDILGGSTIMSSCPDEDWVDHCTQIQGGSGWDYQYDIYQTTTEHKYHKKAGDKDYKVQKYWTEKWERYKEMQ